MNSSSKIALALLVCCQIAFGQQTPTDIGLNLNQIGNGDIQLEPTKAPFQVTPTLWSSSTMKPGSWAQIVQIPDRPLVFSSDEGSKRFFCATPAGLSPNVTGAKLIVSPTPSNPSSFIFPVNEDTRSEEIDSLAIRVKAVDGDIDLSGDIFFTVDVIDSGNPQNVTAMQLAQEIFSEFELDGDEWMWDDFTVESAYLDNLNGPVKDDLKVILRVEPFSGLVPYLLQDGEVIDIRFKTTIKSQGGSQELNYNEGTQFAVSVTSQNLNLWHATSKGNSLFSENRGGGVLGATHTLMASPGVVLQKTFVASAAQDWYSETGTKDHAYFIAGVWLTVLLEVLYLPQISGSYRLIVHEINVSGQEALPDTQVIFGDKKVETDFVTISR